MNKKWASTNSGTTCPSCMALHNQVHSAEDWDDLTPGHASLYCQEHCNCTLNETDEAESGDLTGVPLRQGSHSNEASARAAVPATSHETEPNPGQYIAGAGQGEKTMPNKKIMPILYSQPIIAHQALPDRATILPQIESGQLEFIEFEARTFRQETKPNRNYVRFRDEDLLTFANSFKGQPFLRNHDQHDIGSRDGTIAGSKLESKDFLQTIKLTTRAGMLAYVEGQIDRFSIGWYAEWIMCSICEQDWLRCSHWPGHKYKVGENQTEKLCELVMMNPKGKETSAVNAPAVEGTGLLEELTQFKLEVIGKPAETHTRRTPVSTRSQDKGGPMRKKRKVQVEGENGEISEIEIVEVEPSPQEQRIEANRQAAAQLLGETERMNALEDQLAESNAVLVAQCEHLLNSGLAASKLPDVVQARIRKQFTGRAFKAAELTEAISEAKDELATVTAGQIINGPSRIGGMVTSDDQIRAAVDDMFNVKRDESYAKAKPARLSGIRELYLMLTGDYDFHGGYYGERMQLATTADFAGLVKNALNKAVVAQWEALGREGYNWWESIVDIQHFNTLNQITGILVGTVGLLPTVEEQAEYTELAVGDSPEVAAFVKKGGYVPLTLELIDRDETAKLKIYPRELASAALRTLSARIADVFTSASGAGPTMADTGALFNNTAVTTLGGHANLLTTALSATEWDVVGAAVYNQPMLIKQAAGYYGTGPKMAVEPRFALVPRAMRKLARETFLTNWDVAANVHSENLLKGEVVPLIVPEFTDANNWAAVCDPKIAPGIVVGERFGIKPEIYIAGRETDAAVFMNDEHRIKVRMFNAILVQDFRPLHKSNVA